MKKDHFMLKNFGPVGLRGRISKISKVKVGLVMYHWKDLFKIRILVKSILAFDDYWRIYRDRQKWNLQVTSILSISQTRTNLGKRPKNMFSSLERNPFWLKYYQYLCIYPRSYTYAYVYTYACLYAYKQAEMKAHSSRRLHLQAHSRAQAHTHN